MFTGIVEEKGKVRYIQLTGESGILAVKARKVLEGTRIGDSIAVNGVCLTVTSIQPDGFTADVMAETIRRSSLGSCKMCIRDRCKALALWLSVSALCFPLQTMPNHHLLSIDFLACRPLCQQSGHND